MNKEGLAKNIIYYRKKKGLSQEKLSEYIGVSRQAVTKWENDSSRPSSDHLIKLAELFGVSVDALLDHEEQGDLAKETQIATGKMPWLFIGISVLCILVYLLVSVRSDVFRMGALTCMFILCVPIQLFLHIYLTNAVHNNTFHGIAGFDDKVDYNIGEVKKLLVQINLHTGMTATVYIFLLSIVNCMNPGIEWLNGFLMIMYAFDFAAVVMINNYKMADRIYRKEEDKERARLSIPVTAVYLLLLFVGLGIIYFIFEMKGIQNNTIPALKLSGLMVLGVAAATVGFMLESRQIKKWNCTNTKYKINKVSVASLCLCVILYGLMFFI